MSDFVCAAMLAVVLFAAMAPLLGRRLPPALATRLLVPASLALAASSVFVLGTLALTWLVQLPPIAALGSWSTTRLRADDPVPAALAVLCLVLLVAASSWAAVWITKRVHALLRVYRTYRDLDDADPVVVIDSPRPDAFTTPAPSARIIVTAALWKALTPAERRVVLAHEGSHLAHRHTWWTLTADFAAAVNPLLRPTAATIAHAVERWADEDAARTVGDRRLVARTIARAALLKYDAAHQPNGMAVSATGGDVPQRVRALLAPPPRRRPLALIVLAMVFLVGAGATLAVERSSDRLFDQVDVHIVLTGGHPHHQPVTCLIRPCGKA